MHLIILMVNMLMSRFFGFRHRETEDIEDVYRPLDIVAGVGLPFLVALPVIWLSTLVGRFIAFPTWLNSICGALCVGGGIFLATTWMPFLEHLSLVNTGEMTARKRRNTVILARTIPYLYGLVALGFAAAVAVMFEVMIGFVLVGIATFLRLNLASVPVQTWAWIGGVIGLVLTLAFAREAIRSARLDADWGLPTWRTFIEPGQRHSAGDRFFRPLDRTIGRLILMVTMPTAKMREIAATTPEVLRVSDYRRFDGDPIDLLVSICAAGLLVGLIATVGTTFLSWVAPDLFANLATTMSTSSAASGSAPTMKPTDMAMLFGVGLVVLPSMFGCIRLLRVLASRSSDDAWASQPWVRWLARALDIARILSLAVVALLLGAVLAMMLGTSVQLGRLGEVAVFTITALVIAFALLNLPLGNDSYLRSFVANVEAANRASKASTSRK